jgi:hypothetical protein
MTMKQASAVLGVFVLALGAGRAYGGDPNYWTWRTIDYPGALTADPTAISGNNIVGHAWVPDANSPVEVSTVFFLYDGTTWTILSYPGASGTGARGISGDRIVGWYEDDSNNSHGFLLSIPEPTTPGALSLGGLTLFRRR